MPHPLSVIVITRNEERNIDACLRSVAWADDIVVVDAESADRTVEFARRYTDRVFIERWAGFSAAKTSATAKALHEWVLWIDADERVTPALAEEIRGLLSGESIPCAGYRMPRKAYFLGKWIRHCGWYPGEVLRLFRKSRARFSDSPVHESLILDGPAGRLRGDLDHYTDEDLDHYFVKFNSYTTLAAGELHRSGRRAGLAALLFRPAVTFFKMYILKRGFLDGMHGFVLCALSAAYVFAKYAKLWHLGARAGSAEDGEVA